MKTDAMIRKEGFQALKEKLGIVEFERFLVIMSREKFDYTKWRKSLFEDQPLEELAKNADEYSREEFSNTEQSKQY